MTTTSEVMAGFLKKKGFYPGFPTVKGENLTDLICTGKLI